MYSTVLQYLEETALKYPDKAAFIDLKEKFSFEELLYNAKRIGSFILENVQGKRSITGCVQIHHHI